MSPRPFEPRFHPCRALALALALLLPACGGAGGAQTPVVENPPDLPIYEGPSAPKMLLSSHLGELARGLPRVAVDDLGNALAVWPVFRPQAGEDGMDRHPLHFVVQTGQVGPWGGERLLPGTGASILPNLDMQVAKPATERLLAGSGSFLLAWTEGDPSGPHTLRLTVYTVAADSWSPVTDMSLDAGETILDASVDGPGFVVLTGVLNQNGRTWVRRMRHDGAAWQPAEIAAERTNSELAVVAAAVQSGARTAVLLREFGKGANGGERLSVQFIGAALTPASPTGPFDTQAYTLPSTSTQPLPEIMFPLLGRCGAGVVVAGVRRTVQVGNTLEDVMAVTATPGIGLGAVTTVGPAVVGTQVLSRTLGLWSGGENAAGCVVAWKRQGWGATARRQQAAVHVNGIWGAMRDLGEIFGDSAPLIVGGPSGFAMLYGSASGIYLRPGVYKAAVYRIANMNWVLSGVSVRAIPLDNDPASPAPAPILAALGNTGYGVVWVDGLAGLATRQQGLYFAGGASTTWSSWQPTGLSGSTPVLLGGAGGGGRMVAAWSTPPQTTGVNLSSAPAGGATGGAWETVALMRLPTPPAMVAPHLRVNPFGDAVAAWRDAQGGATYSRLYRNGEWSATPPANPDITGGEAIYLRNDTFSSVVQWSRSGVIVRELPGGTPLPLTPVGTFNISGVDADDSGPLQMVAWSTPDGVFACVRGIGLEPWKWQCRSQNLFDAWFLGRDNLVAGPGGFALIGTGASGPAAGKTLVRIFQTDTGWGPQAELDTSTDWSLVGGYSSYMAAGAQGDKVDIRLYTDGKWSGPVIVGPFPTGVGGAVIRNVRAMVRVGGGYAVLWEVDDKGARSVYAALYRAGKWEREVLVGEGRLGSAAARTEGFMVVLRSTAPDGSPRSVLKLLHGSAWIPLPPLADGTPDGTPLSPVGVAAGRYSYGLTAVAPDGGLYGLRYAPAAGGSGWEWTLLPRRLDTAPGPLPLDISVAVSGANYLSVWTQADGSDPLAPQVRAAGF